MKYQLLCKGLWLAACCLQQGPLIAQMHTVQHIPLLPGEYWWGALVNAGHEMPFQAGAVYDLLAGNRDNQAQPLLLSSMGRYVWSEAPFRFSLSAADLQVEGPAACEVRAAGGSLREAYLHAAAAHFPADGQLPAETFFSAPQWNTWIELGYGQRQERILEYAHTILREGFPPGILMLDDTWQEDYGVWRFHPGRFPGPRQMIDTLHALGFQVMLWIVPAVSPDSYEFRELRAAKALLVEQTPNSYSPHYVKWIQEEPQPALVRWWNGASAMLDFGQPAASAWLTAQLDRLQQEYAVDGFKFDGGDWYFFPAYAASALHASEQARAYGEIGLRYPLNEYRAAWKMGGRPLVQRLQDKNHSWEDLRQLIPHMLAQGMLGYSFGCPDMIGGGMLGSFGSAALDQELFVRSAQIHALMPMMQFSMAPWRVLDGPHLAAVKTASQLRAARFQPLILSLARASARSGEPIVRHLEYVFPHQGFHRVDDQFMLGDSVLVAPMVRPGSSREVLLPPGNWKADDGQLYTGSRRIRIDVPLERIPWFERMPQAKANGLRRRR
ncbi:MAG: glycoside hydrolase family 31 protein [Bacteroidia bacterium]|nr:glycoside hydrolase family 31 protein [Bacteroidia bacterium]